MDTDRVIQWYPGHMAAAMRRIGEYMKLIDVVIEVVDARVPASGSNPGLGFVAGDRQRLLVLSREDLADPHETQRWLEWLSREQEAVAVNGLDQVSVARARSRLENVAKLSRGARRAMVVGIPNSGKSAVINGLLRRAAAKTEDRAGVTRQLQWFRVGPDLELMDTPGILVPRIASEEAQWKLALVGAVPYERYDPEDIVTRFHRWLTEKTGGQTNVPGLDVFAQSRGFLRSGGEIDYHNAARSYIKEFNDGTFGRITLESAPRDAQAA